MGILYIVSTPIGNLQDISLRALKTLFEVDVIACEDTRRMGMLLQNIANDQGSIPIKSGSMINDQLNHKPRFISYYDQVEKQKTPEIISLLQIGLNVALVSDAGTPLISDPGFKLIQEAIAQGIKVTSIPGPSAVITALTLSGLPPDKFFFIGYLPKKEGHRKDLLMSLKSLTGQLKSTVIFFEAPHRINGTLKELSEFFGEKKQIVVARELTKVYEEVLRDSVGNLLKHFERNVPKGEFVILLNTEN